MGGDIGSGGMCHRDGRNPFDGFNLQGPIMVRDLERRLLELQVELLIARKKAENFEEEKLLNHAIYANKELLDFLEKRNGSGSSS